MSFKMNWAVIIMAIATVVVEIAKNIKK